MFSEVNLNIEDGNLGRSQATGSGIQITIGVSDRKSTVPLLISSTMKVSQIKEKLGNTPLANACMDAAENGLKTNYAIPVAADIAGTIGLVQHTGTGKGIVTLKGAPNNAYHIIVGIVESGKRNEGVFKYSLDGGNTFSEEYMIPMDGAYELPDTGLTLTFTDAENEQVSFVADDTYSVETTAPTVTNQTILKAVDQLKNTNLDFEIVRIIGVSGKALWSALQQEAAEFLDIYKKPVLFICEGRPVNEGETLDEYVAAMKEERRGINSIYICVSLSYGLYVRRDLSTATMNMSGVLAGLLGQAKESLSVGCVKEFPISAAKLLKLLPDGIEEHTRQLDEMGYTVFRQYTGREDYYVSNANVLSPANSDFPYVENVRVLNRIVREVTRRATENLQQEIDPNAVEVSVKKIESELNIAMDDCMDDKIISSGEVTIDSEKVNILVDETLEVHAAWVPMGTVRVFNLNFAVNNPYTASEAD